MIRDQNKTELKYPYVGISLLVCWAKVRGAAYNLEETCLLSKQMSTLSVLT